MPYSPASELTTAANADGSATHRLILTWTSRTAEHEILSTVEKIIAEGVRKHLLEDEYFRNQISEAIKIAATAMPLDVITDTVKKAVSDLRADAVVTA